MKKKIFVLLLIAFAPLFANEYLVVPYEKYECWDFANPAIKIIAINQDENQLKNNLKASILDEDNNSVIDSYQSLKFVKNLNDKNHFIVTFEKLNEGKYILKLDNNSDIIEKEIIIHSVNELFFRDLDMKFEFSSYYFNDLNLFFENSLNNFDSPGNYIIKYTKDIDDTQTFKGLNLERIPIGSSGKKISLEVLWVQPETKKYFSIYSKEFPIKLKAPEIFSHKINVSYEGYENGFAYIKISGVVIRTNIFLEEPDFSDIDMQELQIIKMGIENKYDLRTIYQIIQNRGMMISKDFDEKYERVLKYYKNKYTPKVNLDYYNDILFSNIKDSDSYEIYEVEKEFDELMSDGRNEYYDFTFKFRVKYEVLSQNEVLYLSIPLTAQTLYQNKKSEPVGRLIKVPIYTKMLDL